MATDNHTKGANLERKIAIFVVAALLLLYIVPRALRGQAGSECPVCAPAGAGESATHNRTPENPPPDSSPGKESSQDAAPVSEDDKEIAELEKQAIRAALEAVQTTVDHELDEVSALVTLTAQQRERLRRSYRKQALLELTASAPEGAHGEVESEEEILGPETFKMLEQARTRRTSEIDERSEQNGKREIESEARYLSRALALTTEQERKLADALSDPNREQEQFTLRVVDALRLSPEQESELRAALAKIGEDDSDLEKQYETALEREPELKPQPDFEHDEETRDLILVRDMLRPKLTEEQARLLKEEIKMRVDD